ncbi:MAG: hypothetical protein A2107_15935 [Verrucomicrobia bacterium GWF2_62_7]|nr:MAG: hypothetical protein A2107_15935 [Verrucomicrobia bacterium GWF2_62_7]
MQLEGADNFPMNLMDLLALFFEGLPVGTRKAAEDCRSPRRCGVVDSPSRKCESILDCGSLLPLWNWEGTFRFKAPMCVHTRRSRLPMNLPLDG